MSITKVFLLLCFLMIAHQAITDFSNGAPNVCSHPTRIHWVAALDRSASMGWNTPTRWQVLQDAVNQPPDGLIGTIDQNSDVLTAFLFNWVAFSPIVSHFDVPIGYTLPFTVSPAGDTNFGNAIQRAIDEITPYSDENTGFVMVTDGQSEYPAQQVNDLNNLMSLIQSNGCTVQARCYFIRGSRKNQIPRSYEQLCNAIGAQIFVEVASKFQQGFKKDFKSFYNQFKQKLGGSKLAFRKSK